MRWNTGWPSSAVECWPGNFPLPSTGPDGEKNSSSSQHRRHNYSDRRTPEPTTTGSKVPGSHWPVHILRTPGSPGAGWAVSAELRRCGELIWGNEATLVVACAEPDGTVDFPTL